MQQAGTVYVEARSTRSFISTFLSEKTVSITIFYLDLLPGAGRWEVPSIMIACGVMYKQGVINDDRKKHLYDGMDGSLGIPSDGWECRACSHETPYHAMLINVYQHSFSPQIISLFSRNS